MNNDLFRSALERLSRVAGVRGALIVDTDAGVPVVAELSADVDGTALAKGTETRVWGRFARGPGTPMKGETIPEALKALFRVK